MSQDVETFPSPVPQSPARMLAGEAVPASQQPDKAKQVQQMFNGIAGSYDLLNAWISMGFHQHWKRKACRMLNLKPGDRVLDVCTGTGDLIQTLLQQVESDGRVDGLDFSENMLAIACRRYAGMPNVVLQQGDALALPYADNTFDGAIISFGLRNVADIPRALAEMHRVIRPGGWLVNLDTTPSPSLPGFRFYFSHVMPWIGGLFSRNKAAYRYLAQSTQQFLTPQQMTHLLIRQGCIHTRVISLMMGAVSIQAGQKAG